MNQAYNTINLEKKVEVVKQLAVMDKDRAQKEKRLQDLIDSELGQRVLEQWHIEVFYGMDKSLGRKTHAVKLTNKYDGESVTYLKNKIQNMKNADNILDTLSIIGEVERSFIKFFGNYINAIMTMRDKVILVEDLSLITADPNSEVGLSVVDYYKIFIKDFFENEDKYPTRSSDEYKTGFHHGVILDTGRVFRDGIKEYEKNEFGYPVAIRAGKLKALFPDVKAIASQEERRVIQKLCHLGVMHHSISSRVLQDKDRYDRRIKLVESALDKDEQEKDFHDQVYIFYIIPSLLEGSN